LSDPVPANSFYYKEEPGIKNVSTREKFTKITDTTSVSGVTYEGRCQLPLDEAIARQGEPIWQLWRSGKRTIDHESSTFTTGDLIAEGIGERSFGQIWDDRLTIFGDTLLAFTNTNSIAFNGIDKYLDWGAIANYERTQAFSVSIWSKNSDAGFQHFINRIQGVSPFRGWQVYKDTAQKLTFSLISNASGNNIQTNGDSTVLNDGNWHHIVVTYDGSTNGSGVKMYIDANPEVVSVTADSLSATTLFATSTLVGKRTDGVGHVDGKIEEPAIYTDVLTPTEVTEIYNSGAPIGLKSLASGDTLLAWLQFTQDDIDNFPTIADHSGNANDATATNMVSGDIQGDIPT